MKKMNHKLSFFRLIILLCCFIIQLLALHEDICGRVDVTIPIIQNGNYAIRGLFPWVAVLLNKDYDPFCGGTILTNDLVLTAAHCIKGKDNAYLNKPEDIIVGLGVFNLTNSEENERVFANVSSIEIHKDWNVTTQDHDADLAILTLSQNVYFGKFIKPICLLNPFSWNKDKFLHGVAAGFGKSENNIIEKSLKHLKIPIEINDVKCLKSDSSIYEISSERTFCAGTRNGSGVCSGDSGNGFFVSDRGIYYLRGIVAASKGDPMNVCDFYSYAVFVNALDFYDWIIEKINIRNIALFGSRFISSGSKFITFMVTKIINNSNAYVEINLKQSEKHKITEFEDHVMKIEHPILSNLGLRTELTINSHINKNNCKQQSVKLINTNKSPIVFVQFDKQIYKIGENFAFQVFVLDREMIPITNKIPIAVHITNSENKSRWTIRNLEREEQFGIYKAKFQISSTFKPGEYEINVNVMYRKISKSFQIQNSEQSDDEIFIEMQDVVAFTDRKMYLILYSKEPSGRTAHIYLNAKFENSSIDAISGLVKSEDLKNSKAVFQLDFQDDFGIRFPTENMNLKFTVDVVQAATGRRTRASKEVLMKHKGRNTIQIFRKKFFKPSFTFPIKARIKTFDGKPDTLLNQLTTTIKLISKNGKIEENKYQANLKNGETILHLQPEINTRRILISMEFAETTYSEEVDLFPGVDEYMQVSVTIESLKVGTKARVQVKSTDEMKELHLVIFGTKGIVKHESFQEAEGKDIYEINFELTNEMKPEARGLVFYSRQKDGAIVYDEFSISLGFSIENVLEISAVETAEPDSIVNVAVKTEEGSRVYLVATNANSPQISRDNEISRTSIYDEITFHLNEKYPATSNYHFEKLNAFILEPLVNGTECSDILSRSNFNDDEQDVAPSRVGRSVVQKYYPELLPVQIYVANTSETQNISFKIPDITAKWRFYGISVHPTKSLTVAKTVPEISVKGTIKHKLRLELFGTTSIKQDEIHKITLTAENLSQLELKGTIYITAENGYLYEGKVEPAGSGKCTNDQRRQNNLQFNIRLTPQMNLFTKHFYISAKNLNQIKLKATFEGEIESETDEVFKLIEVQDSKELKTVIIDSMLIESSSFSLNQVPANVLELDTFIDIHGNLLGPALNGLDDIFGQSMSLEEEQILKFATDVIICKYFKYIDDPFHPKAVVARQRIDEYGSKIENFLRNIQRDKEKKLGKLAFISGVLIDAFDYYNATSLVTQALDFIKSKQYYWKNRGTFDYYPEYDNHRDISSAHRKDVQTALITVTLSKTSQYRQIYRNEIKNSLNYLKSIRTKKSGDHLNSIIAYAFALNGYDQDAKIVINDLNDSYKSSTRHIKHYSMYVQALSYMILTKVMTNQDAKEQVQWLLKYRNADGAFFSPYDTVLALQALYEYTKKKDYPLDQYIVRIEGNDTPVNPSESIKYKLLDQNTKIEGHFLYLGYMNLYQQYFDNSISRNSISVVTTTVLKGQLVNSLDITVLYMFRTADTQLGNSIIALEVELPVGYRHYNPYDEVVGYRNNGTTLVYHFGSLMRNNPRSQLITVIKDPNLESYHKRLIIKFYDYYRPNMKDIYKYDALCLI